MSLTAATIRAAPGVFIATLTSSLIFQSPSLNKVELIRFGLTIMGRTAVATACVGWALFAAGKAEPYFSSESSSGDFFAQLTYQFAINAFSFIAGFAAKKFPQYGLGTPLERVVHITLSGSLGLATCWMLPDLVSQKSPD